MIVRILQKHQKQEYLFCLFASQKSIEMQSQLSSSMSPKMLLHNADILNTPSFQSQSKNILIKNHEKSD